MRPPSTYIDFLPPALSFPSQWKWCPLLSLNSLFVLWIYSPSSNELALSVSAYFFFTIQLSTDFFLLALGFVQVFLLLKFNQPNKIIPLIPPYLALAFNLCFPQPSYLKIYFYLSILTLQLYYKWGKEPHKGRQGFSIILELLK